MMYYTYLHSPIGPLLLISNDEQLTGLYFTIYKHAPTPGPDWVEDKSHFAKVISQLEEYFAGKRTSFDIPFAQSGTPFQMSVWNKLARIPYGQRSSYKAVAEAIGKPNAVRAVGTAVGSNPVCIIGPCHRVVASSGKLGGYAGGIKAKEFLLQLETNPA